MSDTSVVPATSYFGQNTIRVSAGTQLVTRPNNVTAYAAGQVWGTETDGRYTFTLPAFPAGQFNAGYTILWFFSVNSRGGADAALPALNYFLCLGGFTTVLADQVAINLNDADIVNVIQSAYGEAWQTPQFATGIVGNALNLNTGLTGRRSSLLNWTPQNGTMFQQNTVIGLYAVMSGAYTPAALETLRITAYATIVTKAYW